MEEVSDPAGVMIRVAEKNRLGRASAAIRADIEAHLQQLDERLTHFNVVSILLVKEQAQVTP